MLPINLVSYLKIVRWRCAFNGLLLLPEWAQLWLATGAGAWKVGGGIGGGLACHPLEKHQTEGFVVVDVVDQSSVVVIVAVYTAAVDAAAVNTSYVASDFLRYYICS